MAYFVTLKEPGHREIYVNVERISYIRESGPGRCMIYFDGGQSLSLDETPANIAQLANAQTGRR